MDNPALQQKIQCPLCHGANTKTLGAQETAGIVVQRRMCLACGERFLLDAEAVRSMPLPPKDNIPLAS